MNHTQENFSLDGRLVKVVDDSAIVVEFRKGNAYNWYQFPVSKPKAEAAKKFIGGTIRLTGNFYIKQGIILKAKVKGFVTI